MGGTILEEAEEAVTVALQSWTEERPRHKWQWLIGAFALCFFACGSTWWGGSYQDYLHRGFSWETVALLGVTALLLSWFAGAAPFASSIATGAALVAVIGVRITLDCLDDPTHHNLWPIEVVLGLGLGMLVTLPPAALGWLLRRFTHRSGR